MSQDDYTADRYKHGGGHVDRYSRGKNIGRYRADRTPISHKGKTPPPIPRADWDRFDKEAEKL